MVATFADLSHDVLAQVFLFIDPCPIEIVHYALICKHLHDLIDRSMRLLR